MYTLDFPQLPQSPTIRSVPELEIQSMSRRSEDRGFFNHNGSFNVPSSSDGRQRLEVRFNPTIYLALGMSQQDQADVQAHEMDHFNDFVSAAGDLRSYLERAVSDTPWDTLSDAWQWFLYYVREDARRLHISMRRDTIVMNPQPRSTNPY